MNQGLFLIIAGILVAANIAFAIYAHVAQKKLKRLREQFQEGGGIINLEEILHAVGANLKRIDKLHKKLVLDIEKTKTQLALATQKVGVHRFNALPDEGGNLSFTIALLNEHNTGLVITSLHTRQNTRIYTKAIAYEQDMSGFSAEELRAIDIAHTAFQTSKS